MTKKIFTGVISVSLIIMLVCVGLVMGIMYDYMGQKLDDQLAAEAILVEDGWKTRVGRTTWMSWSSSGT